jgi:hypothetical protein
MSRAWDDFLPLILPDLPGCPKSLALAAARRGADELCRGAYVWTEELGPMDVSAWQTDYTLPIPSGAVPVILLGLYFQGIPLSAATDEELDEKYPGWSELTAARPLRFIVPAIGKVRLVPKPTAAAAAALTARMVLAPAHDAADVQDLIFEQWAPAVAHAAKAELMAVPGKAWSDPQLAEHHARQFRTHIVRARGRASIGWTRKTMTAEPRTFGA